MVAGRRKNTTNRRGARAGSALILAVVLTSLLAIVGVLFVMVTRIDKMATSAASENRELTFAVNTVAAQISELLAQDVPGGAEGEDYYDFPDAQNAWLADLEPYRVEVGTTGEYDYYWRQISRIAGDPNAAARDVLVDVIGRRDPIVAINGAVTNADADGDGVGDARWVEVPGIMSGRGRPIYAAVRVIDNGGMLNVNTGYWFDPNRADPLFPNPDSNEPSMVDGSSPLQINAIALADGDRANPIPSEDRAEALLSARRVVDLVDGLSDYEKRVIWGYLRPGPYTPFDLSDELELRYRFLVDHLAVNNRVESWGWFTGSANSVINTPVDSGGIELDKWFARAHDAGGLDPNYAYRHVATTYNMDRIITRPADVNENEAVTLQKMVNVNGASEDAILNAITLGLSEPGLDLQVIEAEAVQIAANLIDYIDDDDLVTAIDGPSASGARYYGFERPCVYISEIAHHAVTDGIGEVHHSYAIELHKPYFEDRDPVDDQWQLVIDTTDPDDPTKLIKIVEPIKWSGLRRFHVLLSEDPLAELFDDSAFDDPEEPIDTFERYGYYRRQYASRRAQVLNPAGFREGATFSLQRRVREDDTWLTVDFRQIPRDGWMAPDQGPRSVQRDISPARCIRKLWTGTGVASVTLGRAAGQYVDPNDGGLIQAHPANRTLRNIGELGMVFATSAYGVTRDETAESVLLNLTNPAYAELFNYLTVLDPAEHVTGPDPGEIRAETRVMGRININTAPWFVLAQLPWIQYQDDSVAKSTRARAVVDYREANGPYQNIGELMQVSELHDLAYDDRDNLNDDDPRGPDLTRDSARDDLEERDLLFTRLSNLVTVRSDVFTAYILVRIGANGPQKRMIAIFDRSKTGPQSPTVRIVALHPVADPR